MIQSKTLQQYKAMEVKPVRTETDYRAALKIIDELVDSEDGTEQADLLDVLSILVESYESEHYPIGPPNPIDAIKFRMEQTSTSEAEFTDEKEQKVALSGKQQEIKSDQGINDGVGSSQISINPPILNKFSKSDHSKDESSPELIGDDLDNRLKITGLSDDIQQFIKSKHKRILGISPYTHQSYGQLIFTGWDVLDDDLAVAEMNAMNPNFDLYDEVYLLHPLSGLFSRIEVKNQHEWM